MKTKAPCVFCDYGKSLINKNGVYTFVDKGRLVSGYSDGCTFEVNDSIKINYCPMCGRKLEEEN